MTAKQNELKWKLEKILESDDLKECELKFGENNPVLDGFAADVFLAELSGISQDNTKINQKVFIKCGKDADIFKEALNVSSVYERESFFYTALSPAFSAFLKEKKISFDYVPSCLASVMIENRRIIIMEDLKSQGYKLNDVHTPMTFDHMKLVFKTYALFHSISIAFRDQKPEEFEKLTSNLDRLFIEKFMLGEDLRNKYENHNNKLYTMLEEMGETVILERWKEVLNRDTISILRETCEYKIKETVVAHLDCWNNNMMFKYQNADDDKIPCHVKLLDFQLTAMTSPVIDLACFFYFNCCSTTAARFDELMECYYENFSLQIKRMGSDPEKLFPFKLLKKHWRNYSMYGVIRCWSMIHSVLCDKGDLVAFEEMENIADFFFKDDYKIKNIHAYKDRILAVVKHYFAYQDKYSNVGDK